MINRPVVVGVAAIQQKGNFEELDEALILMDKAAKSAIKDAGNESIKNYIDEIRIPKGFWKYRDPGKWIAKNNNFKENPTTYVTKIGVLQQNLINEACLRIERGDIRASIILGGEARYKRLRSKIEKKNFQEKILDENPDFYIKAKENLYGDEELKALGSMAVGYYAVIETALRRANDESLQEHQEKIGKMYQNFSEQALKNKNSWADRCFSAEDIISVSEKNKMMAYPYNKYHCTSWNVNQSAALIICSEEIADELEIDFSNRVYPVASTENNHMIAVQQRPKLYESIGMDYAANKILEFVNKLNITIDKYDLYSCFPAAVKMFQNSLKIEDGKQISITGSMPFAGGPLNSYVLHSSVQMIKEIRAGKTNYGLVTGVSGMMTKQSFCIWGIEFKEKFLFFDVSKKARADELPLKLLTKSHGSAKVVGYTFYRDTDMSFKAVLYIEDEKKSRKVVTSKKPEFIKRLKIEDWVGKYIKYNENQVSSW